MVQPPRVLLVTPTPALTAVLFPWLVSLGCDVTVVTAFAAAKAQLDSDPALLISEIRLRDYNGLHLAFRAQARHIPTVLLGDPDPVLQREAEQLGATYLPHQFDRERLLPVIESITRGRHAAARHTLCPATNVPVISRSDFHPTAGRRADLLSRTWPTLPS